MALRLHGRVYLFDAGEGTQVGLKKLHLGVRGLDVLAVTHLHGDHCLGVPGLMMLRTQMENPEPLTILGPPGIEQFVRANLAILDCYLNYPVHFVEWNHDSGGTAYQDERTRIFWRPLKHTRFCLGYRIEEHERAGEFFPEKALALNVPQGPLWRRLQQGESVTLETGKVVAPDDVMGEPRRGRHAAFVVDTRPTPAANDLCREVDIAFLEGMFLPEHAEHARMKGHLTVEEAAFIARESGAARGVLVHLSPRYGDDELELLEKAAQKVFKDVEVGRDFKVYPLLFRPHTLSEDSFPLDQEESSNSPL
jgi:ribonuclease Z